jgi:hypothetical protein
MAHCSGSAEWGYTMGMRAYRDELETKIDAKFGSAAKVRETKQSLGALSASDDVIDILKKLGCLDHIPEANNLESYRTFIRKIPKLHLRVLTEAFRTSLSEERPLRMTFLHRQRVESVRVTDIGSEIAV